MKEPNPTNNVAQLIRVAAMLWLGYVLALLIIDGLFRPRPPLSLLYYGVNGLNVLLVLGIAERPSLQAKLDQLFLPTMIIMMSVVPIIINHLFILPLPPGPQTMPETTALRLMPMMFMALVLTAWQYRWRYVVLFSLGIAAFIFGMHSWYYRPRAALLQPSLIVLIIQTISLLIVGYFISTLMERLRSQQESLEQANARLTHYASTLERLTISRERNRVARELHDTLAHTLSGLSVQLETAKAYWEVDSTTAQTLLNEALTAARAGLQETRRALQSLRASPLDDLGLGLALRQLAESAGKRANLKIDFSAPECLPLLSPDVEQCIYRVAQEAITNVMHHANAHSLAVALTCTHRQISLTVRDDGVGFDIKQSEQANHYGLPGLRERAALAGGTLRIDSQPGYGTLVQLDLRGAIE
jgi:signal transduction histidine kinase